MRRCLHARFATVFGLPFFLHLSLSPPDRRSRLLVQHELSFPRRLVTNLIFFFPFSLFFSSYFLPIQVWGGLLGRPPVLGLPVNQLNFFSALLDFGLGLLFEFFVPPVLFSQTLHVQPRPCLASRADDGLWILGAFSGRADPF